MNIQTRLLITYVVRLVFLFFAVWVALMPDALPGAHLLLRIGLVALFLVFSILVGEVFRLHTQFEMFVRALRSAGVKVSDDGGRNDREAVTILIRALSSREEATREKAHRNLVRLTGQDLPPEKAVWERWWKEARKKL